MDQDSHYYAYYVGKVVLGTEPAFSDGIIACTFKNQKVFCYESEMKPLPSLEKVKVYFSKCKYGKLILLAKNTERGHREIKSSVSFRTEAFEMYLLRHGNYGCVPGFIKGSNGIAYLQKTDHKVITLYIARHDMVHPVNNTVLELEPHDFPISDSDFIKLNTRFMNDNNIQGGVDTVNLQELKVYSSTDVLLETLPRF